jgi:hypothetical protein
MLNLGSHAVFHHQAEAFMAAPAQLEDEHPRESNYN